MKLKKALFLLLSTLAFSVVTGCGSTPAGVTEVGAAPEPAIAADPNPVPAAVADPDGSLHRHHASDSIHQGVAPWGHWNHPSLDRPTFTWKWELLKSVTCTAEDSRGDYYPVREDGYAGAQYRDTVSRTEDASLDRCFSQSGGDHACRIHDCAPEY